MANYTLMFLEYIEPDVKLYARNYHIKGMDFDDVAQELRYHLWKKMHKYNPYRGSPRTWSWRVMRNKLTDMSRKRLDWLDIALRFPNINEGHELVDWLSNTQYPV